MLKTLRAFLQDVAAVRRGDHRAANTNNFGMRRTPGATKIIVAGTRRVWYQRTAMGFPTVASARTPGNPGVCRPAR